MSKRIRYEEHTQEGVVKSKHIYTSMKTGAQYRVFLDLENITYKIKNVNSENVYRGGEKINNLNVLKRTVKNRLTKMGVCFDQEVRKRTFGKCVKGYTQKKHILNN